MSGATTRWNEIPPAFAATISRWRVMPWTVKTVATSAAIGNAHCRYSGSLYRYDSATAPRVRPRSRYLSRFSVMSPRMKSGGTASETSRNSFMNVQTTRRSSVRIMIPPPTPRARAPTGGSA